MPIARVLDKVIDRVHCRVSYRVLDSSKKNQFAHPCSRARLIYIFYVDFIFYVVFTCVSQNNCCILTANQIVVMWNEFLLVYCIVVYIVVKLMFCLLNISARHMDDWKLTTSPVVRLKRSVTPRGSAIAAVNVT